MKNESNESRKKFLLTGASFAAMATFLSFKWLIPSNKKTETQKFLTQDGKLVEINSAKLPGNKKKITDSEINNWIKE